MLVRWASPLEDHSVRWSSGYVHLTNRLVLFSDGLFILLISTKLHGGGAVVVLLVVWVGLGT